MSDTEIKKAVCMWCHSHCKVDAFIEDGRLVRIEGASGDPRTERLRRIVRDCPRQRAVTEYYYHPDRLTFPLKRAGDRGSGKWQQISWDQALDEISAKIAETKAKYGAEALATTSGTYRTDDEYRRRFTNLFGSPNSGGAGNVCYGPGAMGVAALGWWNNFGGPGSTTKTLFYWGTNPEQSYWHLWIQTLELLARGMKFVVVDPRGIPATEKADFWLKLRPGTDAALALSMINVIIEEDLYDKDFVENWTVGFDKLRERARQYPPEKAAEITGVPADQIRDVSRLYATNKPGVIFHSMGLEHLPTCEETYHAVTILAGLTGNLDVRGGEELRRGHSKIISEYEMELNDRLPPEQKAKAIGADRFKLQNFPGFELINKYAKGEWGSAHICFAHAPSLFRTILSSDPYPIRAMISAASNPLVALPDTKTTYKAIKSLDLYVVHEFWLTPSAELADYVLPCACWLERPRLHTWSDTVAFVDGSEMVMPPKVEGKFDRWNDFDFWRGLGIRLGQEKDWPWATLEEAIDYRLSPMGLTLKQFMKEKGGFEIEPKVERKYETIGFGTPSGKMELYSSVLEQLGYDPLPQHYEPVESPVSNPELAKEYPLMLITGMRVWPYYHSEHRQLPSLREQRPWPTMQIHPETAAPLGISEGDWVWIETQRGRIRQKAELFKEIDPGVVSVQHGWWYPEMPGEEPWLHGVWESNQNVLVSGDPEQCCRINGAWPCRAALCKVYKVESYPGAPPA